MSQASETTETTEISPELSQLLEKRESLFQQQMKLNQQLKMVQSEIDQVKKDILKTCDHVWERECVYCGPYEKPDNICRRCNSIQYRF